MIVNQQSIRKFLFVLCEKKKYAACSGACEIYGMVCIETGSSGNDVRIGNANMRGGGRAVMGIARYSRGGRVSCRRYICGMIERYDINAVEDA